MCPQAKGQLQLGSSVHYNYWSYLRAASGETSRLYLWSLATLSLKKEAYTDRMIARYKVQVRGRALLFHHTEG